MNVGKTFISLEERRQLEEEYKINEILFYLHDAGIHVGFNTTIKEAIKFLTTKTRFAKEVEERVNKEFYPLKLKITHDL